MWLELVINREVLQAGHEFRTVDFTAHHQTDIWASAYCFANKPRSWETKGDPVQELIVADTAKNRPGSLVEIRCCVEGLVPCRQSILYKLAHNRSFDAW